jgi:hypothetical protein
MGQQKLNDIRFIQGQGGSGRQAAGTDHISGLMFYSNTRPSAFTDNFSTGGVHQIFSPADAVALGIDGTYSDETKSTATVLITAIGADGDTFELKVTEGSGTVISLGTYTKVAADTTTALVAAGLTAAINTANTSAYPHGYSATLGGSTVTITARPGMGVFLNTGTPYSKVTTGTIAGTLTQNVVVGIASEIAIWFYHISQYFRMKPDGNLYVGIFNVAGAADFSDIQKMQQYALGSIVQLGIWDKTQTFALASLTKLQTQITALRNDNRRLSSIVYSADIKAIATPLTTLSGNAYNVRALSAANVSALIDNDGSGLGRDLFYAYGKTISSLGACIGCISESSISEDIGNPIDRFNCDNGFEFNSIMFGDGTKFEAVSVNQRNQLNANGYIYLSKIDYTPGAFYSDDHTSVALSSDYSYIHDNRILDRVVKDEFRVLIPVLKSKLKLQSNGTMSQQTIEHIQQLAGEPIKALIASGDLATDPENFDPKLWIKIDANQKPNVTGKLVIAIQLLENAIAHSIEVPIGYVSSLI